MKWPRIPRIKWLWDREIDTSPEISVTEMSPVLSRRRFLFLGAAAAGSLILPKLDILTPEDPEFYLGVPADVISYDAFLSSTISRYAPTLVENFLSYRPAIKTLFENGKVHRGRVGLYLERGPIPH